jgi:hypothetical protein
MHKYPAEYPNMGMPGTQVPGYIMYRGDASMDVKPDITQIRPASLCVSIVSGERL